MQEPQGPTCINPRHETSERIFHEPIEILRQKNVTNNLTDNSTQDFGETAKALGENDFLKELQHNYEEAGKPICFDLETILIREIEPLVTIYNIENEGSELLANLCRKAAYTMEILCWQNIRDVIADEIIPRTDEHIEKLLTATKTIPGVNKPMFMMKDALDMLQREIEAMAGTTECSNVRK